jgi:hypothetical protein
MFKTVNVVNMQHIKRNLIKNVAQNVELPKCCKVVV